MSFFRFIKNLFFRAYLLYLFIKLFFVNTNMYLRFYPAFLKAKTIYYFIQFRAYCRVVYKSILDYYSIYYQIRSNFFKKIFKLNFRILKRLIPLARFAQNKLAKFNLKIPDALQRRRAIFKFFYTFILQAQLTTTAVFSLTGWSIISIFLRTFLNVRVWGLLFLFRLFCKRVYNKITNLKTRLYKRKELNILNINISPSLLNKFYYIHVLLDEGVPNNISDPFQIFNGKHPAYIQNYVAVGTTSNDLYVDSEKVSVLPFGSDLLDFDYFPEGNELPMYVFNYYEFDILDRDIGTSIRKRFLYWLDLNYYLGNNRPLIRSKMILQTRALLAGVITKTKILKQSLQGQTISSIGELKAPFSISSSFNLIRRDRTRQANYYSKSITLFASAVWVILVTLTLVLFVYYFFKLRHEQHLWGIANTHFKHAVGLSYSDLVHWPAITRYSMNYLNFPVTHNEWNMKEGLGFVYAYNFGLYYNLFEYLMGQVISLVRWAFYFTRGYVESKHLIIEGFMISDNLNLNDIKLEQNVFMPTYKYFGNPLGFIQSKNNILIYLDLPHQHRFFILSIADVIKDFFNRYSSFYWGLLFITLAIPGIFYLLRVYILPIFGFFSYESIFSNMKVYLSLFTRFYYYTESNSPLAKTFANFDKRKNYYSYLYFLSVPSIKDKRFLNLFYENIHLFSEEFLSFKFNYLASLREKFSSTVEERRLISQYYTNQWMWWLPSIEKDLYNEYPGDFLEAETDDELDEGGAEYLENEEIMRLKDISYQVAPLRGTPLLTRFTHKWNIRLFMNYSTTRAKGSIMFAQDLISQEKEFMRELDNKQRLMWTKHLDISSSFFREWYQKEFIELYVKQMSLFSVAENEIHHKFKYYYKNLVKRRVNLHPHSILNLDRIMFRAVNLPHMSFDDSWNEDQSLSMIHYYDSSYFQKRISKGEAILKAFSFYLFYRQRMFRKLRAYNRYFNAQEDAVMDPTNFKHTKIAIREYTRYKGYYDLYKSRLFNTVADATIRWDEYELESYYDHEQPLSNWFENALIAKIGVSDSTLSKEITLDMFVPEIRSTLRNTTILPDVNQIYWARDNYTTFLSSVEDSNENTEYLNFSEGVPYLIYILNGYFATKYFSIFSEQEYILDTPLPENVTHLVAEPGAPHPMYLLHRMRVLSTTAGLPLKLNPTYPHEAMLYKKYRNKEDIPHEVINRWSVPDEKKYMYKLPNNWRTFINIFEMGYMNPLIGDYDRAWMHEEDIWVFYPEGYAWDTLM